MCVRRCRRNIIKFPVYIAGFQAVDFHVRCLFIVSFSVTYKFCVFVPGVWADDEKSAPLLIYYNKCQDPARGQLKLLFHSDTLLHTKCHPRGCSTFCVGVCHWDGVGVGGGGGARGGYYEPTEQQPIGLSRLPALNNGGVKGRKEGRGTECTLLG